MEKPVPSCEEAVENGKKPRSEEGLALAATRLGSLSHPAANHKGLIEGRGVTPRLSFGPCGKPRGQAAASNNKAAPHNSRSTATAAPHSP